MKKKLLCNAGIRLLTFLLCLVASVSPIAAQTRVKGTVKGEDGTPLVGATVVVVGSNDGATTDYNGAYVLLTKTLMTSNDELEVSYIGYITKTIPYKQGEIDFTLQEDSQALEEVVVTALGIKRQEKALGYATQSIMGEDIANTMPTNWSSGLTGKVAGLNITSAGGATGSTQINLRGNVSLDATSNGALIIVDGVPLSDDMVNDGGAYGAGSTGELSLDFGNGFNDLNSNDIENIQVLKGATAAALYGTRAANGVVLITTKSGDSRNKGVTVNFSSNFSVEKVANLPDFQYQFGQGLPDYIGAEGTEWENQLYYSYNADSEAGLSNTRSTSSAYGAAFEGQMFYQYDPMTQTRGTEATEWVAYENNRSDLFQTGFTTTNSVSISNATEKGSIRASITHTLNEWILPNTGYERIQASVAAQQQMSDRLHLNFRTSYTNKQQENTPAMSYSGNTISYFMIFQNPNVDLAWLEPMWSTGQEGIQQLQPFSSYIGNPYVTLYENVNPQNKHSIISSVSATYSITDKLSLMVRSALSMDSDQRESNRTISDRSVLTGSFAKTNIFNYEINSDFLLSYNNQLSDDFSVSANFGGNVMYSYYDYLKASVTGLMTPGVYMLSNGSSATSVTTIINRKAVNSLYFTAGASYKDRIFLDVTGRNDWSSTLPAQNRSFFYPSVSLSTLVDEFVALPSAIDMFKVRLSYASVGNDTSPYKTSAYYNTSDFVGSATVQTNLYNTDFKPEISTSYEVGTDIRLFKNRLGVDFTYYYNETKNQILSAGLDSTTGYSSATVNAGNVRNRGFEVTLNATPVRTKDFSWRTTLNWSANKNTVLSLANGFDDQMVVSSIGSAYIIATVGGSSGDIWGYKLKRNDEGQVVISSSGYPETTSDIECIGNANPDWTAGWNNTFSYKGLSLSVQFDGQYGGMTYSHTHHKMSEQGKLTNTLNGRVEGSDYYIAGDDYRLAEQGLKPVGGVYMVAPGVVDNGDGTYSPNEKIVYVEDYYVSYYKMANVETNTFYTSYLKLREVRLNYDLSGVRALQGTFLQRAQVGIYGTNLFCITNYPVYDPEYASLSGSSMVKGIETGTLASSKTYGVSLNLTF